MRMLVATVVLLPPGADHVRMSLLVQPVPSHVAGSRVAAVAAVMRRGPALNSEKKMGPTR